MKNAKKEPFLKNKVIPGGGGVAFINGGEVFGEAPWGTPPFGKKGLRYHHWKKRGTFSNRGEGKINPSWERSIYPRLHFLREIYFFHERGEGISGTPSHGEGFGAREGDFYPSSQRSGGGKDDML